MEFPPPEWDCFPLEDFDTAAVRNPLNRGVELLAQARPNGRLLDHVRVVLGGDEIITARIEFSYLLHALDLPKWYFVYSIWPRAIKIRRNMTSSEWEDARAILAANDARVELDNQQQVDQKEVLDFMDKIPDKQANSAAVRWAVIVGEDSRMKLALQCLPAPVSSFSGKPVLRRYKSIYISDG